MLTDNLRDSQIKDLMGRVRDLETRSPLRSSSITSGRLRVGGTAILLVDSDGGIVVEGRLTGTGTLEWTQTVNLKGTTTITGPTTITGSLTAKGATRFEGDTTQVGPHHVQGNQDITGTLAVKGAATLENNLTLSGANAKITAGVVSLDNGGTLRSTNALLIVATGLTSVQNNLYVGGTLTAGSSVNVSGALTVTGAKSFRMEHPLDPTMWLQHGSTESPVSGIEYWGDAVLDDDGAATVDLPSYFDALAKPDGRTAFVTGRGFSPDWSDIDGNTFTVAGSPGGRFSWLVKAERFGGDFEAEQAIPAEIPGSTQPPPST